MNDTSAVFLFVFIAIIYRLYRNFRDLPPTATQHIEDSQSRRMTIIKQITGQTPDIPVISVVGTNVSLWWLLINPRTCGLVFHTAGMRLFQLDMNCQLCARVANWRSSACFWVSLLLASVNKFPLHTHHKTQISLTKRSIHSLFKSLLF